MEKDQFTLESLFQKFSTFYGFQKEAALAGSIMAGEETMPGRRGGRSDHMTTHGPHQVWSLTQIAISSLLNNEQINRRCAAVKKQTE